MQEGLAERTGKDIGEQADSWELKRVPPSTPIRACMHKLIYLALALSFCGHNGVSYTYKSWAFVLEPSPPRKILTVPD